MEVVTNISYEGNRQKCTVSELRHKSDYRYSLGTAQYTLEAENRPGRPKISVSISYKIFIARKRSQICNTCDIDANQILHQMRSDAV